MADKETITVTGTRILRQDGEATLQFHITRTVTDTSGGGSSTTTTIPVEDMMKEIRKLDSGDRIIIQVGKMRAVIDGKQHNEFFEKVFGVVSRIMVGIEQGTLRDDLLAAFPKSAVWINDLIDDLKAMGEAGRYVRITNVTDLAAAARSHAADGDEQTTAIFTGALTIYKPQPDVGNYDGDDLSTMYHQIYMDTSKIRQNQNSSTSRIQSGEQKYMTIEIQLIHELFHIAEGEKSSWGEFAKFGVTVTDQNRHDKPFDIQANQIYQFIKKHDELGIIPTVQRASGSAGNDSIDAQPSAFHLLDVDAGDGNDFISAVLKSGTLAGGAGDDSFSVTPGSGTLLLSGGDGFDTLIVPGGVYAPTVEFIGGWYYLGFQGGANLSASETDNFVFWRAGQGPEQITIGGVSYSEASLQAIANSKPVSYWIPTLQLQAPWYHGFVFEVGGYDPDGDALSYTILSVTGTGGDSQWWLSGSSLYTSFQHMQNYTFYTTVNLRVSDGQFYHDYSVSIEWQPDPNGNFENYSFVEEESTPMGLLVAAVHLPPDAFFGPGEHGPKGRPFSMMEAPLHPLEDLGGTFVV